MGRLVEFFLIEADWRSGGDFPRANLRRMPTSTVRLYVMFANNLASCFGTAVSPDGEYIACHDVIVRPAWNSGSLPVLPGYLIGPKTVGDG